MSENGGGGGYHLLKCPSLYRMHEMCKEDDALWLLVYDSLYSSMPDVAAHLFKSMSCRNLYQHFHPSANTSDVVSRHVRAECSENCDYFHKLCHEVEYTVVGKRML